jgi:hypothetical protein
MKATAEATSTTLSATNIWNLALFIPRVFDDTDAASTRT